MVTDLCLCLNRCAVQASGRVMALMVAQERARWLNLTSLSQKEKTQLINMPVDPKGLFGPAVAAIQKHSSCANFVFPKRCSVPKHVAKGMFQSLQKACRGYVSVHSSRRNKKEEDWTCNKLYGATVMSHMHTPVPKHTPMHTLASFPSNVNKHVSKRISRPRAKDEVMFENKEHKKGTDSGLAVTPEATRRCHDSTLVAAGRLSSCSGQNKCHSCTTAAANAAQCYGETAFGSIGH